MPAAAAIVMIKRNVIFRVHSTRSHGFSRCPFLPPSTAPFYSNINLRNDYHYILITTISLLGNNVAEPS
jgi:hypothetical protein